MSSAPVSLPVYFGSKPKGMITTQEVAKLLKVSTVTVHNYRARGEFPEVVALVRLHSKGNSQHLYNTQAVLDWAEKLTSKYRSVKTDSKAQDLQARLKVLSKQLDDIALELSRL